MKKILAMTALGALAACSQPKPTVENQANAMESDILNRAAAMDNEAETATNAAAMNAINSAAATYNSSVDSIHAEGDAAKNGN